MNKKGALSIETIIIIILALLVLVIVVAAFSGGMKQLWDRIIGIESTIPQTEQEQAIATCQSYCDAKSPVFYTHEFSGNLAGKKCGNFVVCNTMAPV